MCIHNWKKLYYRKKSDKQKWYAVPNTFICDKCLKIRKLR